MNTQTDKSYQDRLKKMKESIDKNKDILDSEFPDDVTVSGSPELLDKEDGEIEKREVKDLNEARQKLEEIMKKEKLTNTPINSGAKNKPKGHNK